MMKQDPYESLAGQIDDTLVFLSLSQNRHSELLSGVGRPVLAMGDVFADGYAAARQSLGLPTDMDARELPGLWDSSVIFQAPGCKFTVERAARIPSSRLQNLRTLGVLSRNSVAACNYWRIYVRPDGTFTVMTKTFERPPDSSRWSPVGGWGPVREEVSAGRLGMRVMTTPMLTSESLGLRILMPVYWFTRRSWRVSFSLEGSASVTYLTDPTGIKELLRLRDRPEGRTRREALLHWVSAHWRQNRFDEDTEVEVRQHLRGGTRTSWYGMSCELEASDPDIDRNSRLAVERRARGRSVRPRVAK